MPPGLRDQSYDALLPERVEARLLGLGARTSGVLLLAITAFIWVSLLTWSVNDPSLTHHASGARTGNAGGPPGAILSDLLLQMLGLGAVVCLFAPMLWALELINCERVVFFRSKALAYPLSILLLAGALSALPLAPGWPLHHAMGGVLGDLVGEVARALIGAVLGHGSSVVVAGLVLFGAGATAAASSIGADLRDIRDALWSRLRHEASGETWHQRMRDDSTVNPPRITDPSIESRRPFSPAPGHRADGDGSAAGPVGVLLSRIRSGFPGAAIEDHREPVFGKSGGQPRDGRDRSIAAQFAENFDPLPELTPGTREVDDEEDDGVGPLSSRSIARRFAPFADQRAPILDEDAPLPEPASAAPGRPARAGRTVRQGTGGLSRPPLTILKRAASSRPSSDVSQGAVRAIGQQLIDVLADYGVKGEIRDIKPGPVVTLYEFEPVRGTKSARVIALADDVARSMSVMSVRAAVVPGRNAIGLELPNSRREPVHLREMLETDSFSTTKAILPLALGRSIGGEPVIADLARMPHLLVAGTTGSGKSVGVNAMILSLLYRHSPDECRFIMIDPKMLELSVYNGIPHLLTPVVTDPHKAVAALGWAVTEMEERYKRMAALSVRNIEAFNQRVRAAAERGETLARTVQTGFDRATGAPRLERQEIDARPMPYIVVVVDEFADLMIVAGKEIEQAVQRLAQMARAAGIHLIMATQRPSVDIITGTIKANFPTRISFKVTSKIDSRTILNEQGAEQLLGHGDMLFSTGAGLITRVHGPFVSDEEVEAVSNFLKAQGEPDYVEGVTENGEEMGLGASGSPARGGGEDDLYERAREIVLRDRKASTSYIQRRLSIGYNKAADLIERMEREGLISPANSTGKREILKPAA